MGRKIDEKKIEAIIKAIEAQDGNVRMNDVARKTGLHPETVSSLLARASKVTDTLLQEDDRGFLGIFRRRS